MTGASVVIPNPRIPSALGTLNIVFGILLLISSVAVVGWSLASPHLAEMVASPGDQQQRETRKREAAAQLAALTKKLESERNPNVRADLQAQIETLEEEQALDDLDADELSGREMKDLRVALPFWADHVLGIVLNALMIISGAGLVALRPWGRKLALSVAGLKMVKLLILTLVAVFLTIPLQVVQSRRAWAKMEARSRRTAPFGQSMGNQVAQMTAISATAMAVGFGATGLIYPALSLWLLNLRSVRAAFQAQPRLPSQHATGNAPPDLS